MEGQRTEDGCVTHQEARAQDLVPLEHGTGVAQVSLGQPSVQIDGRPLAQPMAASCECEAATVLVAPHERSPHDEALGTIDGPEREILMPRKRRMTCVLEQDEILQEHRLCPHDAGYARPQSVCDGARAGRASKAVGVEPLMHQRVEVGAIGRRGLVGVEDLTAAWNVGLDEGIDDALERADFVCGEQARHQHDSMRLDLSTPFVRSAITVVHGMGSRDHSAELRQTSEVAWKEGHRGVFEHLCESTPHWPEGEKGLWPLHQAVALRGHPPREVDVMHPSRGAAASVSSPYQTRYPTPRMDDAALFAAWVAGDQSAGETLYRRHFDALYRFFRGKAPEDYEDLIQNTLLECLRSRGRYRGDAPFRAYLLGVARHRLLHYLRAKGTNRIDFDAEHVSLADVDPRPSTVVARRAEHKRLLEAMRRIPIELQVALELHYWEDLSTAELATVLEIPQGTVKSRLRRGREALQVELEKLSRNPAERSATAGGLETWVRELRGLMGGP